MTLWGGVLTVFLSVLVFCLPRRTAVVAIIAAVCYLTQGQELVVAGFHFTAIRLVLLAGLLRVVFHGELRQLRFNAIDRPLMAYAICLLVITTIRVGTVGTFVFQIGCLYNIILSYFVFRSLLRDEEDVRKVLVLLAFAIMPFALLMVRESWTGYNVFAAFGGVSESSMFRDGHVRSQGAFRSPITAGAFGATLAMLFATMVFAGANRRLALLGLAASIAIFICAHSSGPLLGFALGLLALACWRFRQHTRKIRWGILVALVGLHLVMKAPVWFLLGRISDVVGGDGYHRAYLIDHFVNSFGSWWLAGSSDTGDWMPTQLVSGGADLTNQFVSDGINAGLAGLILSVILIVRCFQRLGTARKGIQANDASTEKMLWGIGATLVASIGILFSVTYFDQMHVVWYFLLACVAAVAPDAVKQAISDLRKSSEQQQLLAQNEPC